MNFIEIKNKKGTGGKVPPSGYASWLEFWEEKKGKKAGNCEVMLCQNRATLGGHVIKVGGGGTEYILAMCAECNNRPDGEVFKGWESDLVPVAS